MLEIATREERLHRLLLTLLDNEALERFIRLKLPVDLAFTTSLPPVGHLSQAAYVDAVVVQLRQHGLLPVLLRRLRHDFPLRAGDVAAVESLWAEAVPPTEVEWTWSDELLTVLKKVLARRLRKQEDIAAVIDEAGIDTRGQTLRPSSADQWSSVLERARRQARVARLITAVQRRVGDADHALSRLVETAMQARTGATPAHPLKATVARPSRDGTIPMSYDPEDDVPLWRRVRQPDQLMFFAPEDGFTGGDRNPRGFTLPLGWQSIEIGRETDRARQRNDIVLPHGTVSAAAVTLFTRDGRAHLRRRRECRNPVKLGAFTLQPGDEHPLHHGQRITIGTVQGVFADGRFTRYDVSPQEIDANTGLLGREGLSLELAQALQLTGVCPLLLVRVADPSTSNGGSARLAAALHHAAPDLPVAHLGDCAAILLSPKRPPEPLYATLVAAVGVPLLAGHHRVQGSPGEAGGRIDEALAALEHAARRIDGGALVDLGDHVFSSLPPAHFQRAATEEISRGGAVVLAALGELDRLQELAPRMVPQLELELFQTITRVAPGIPFLRASPGVLACALPGPPAQILADVAAAWQDRGPIGNGLVLVERSLTTSVVPVEGLARIEARAAELGRSLTSQFEALPLPLALAVRAGYAAQTPLARTTALFALVEACSRFIPTVLACTATQRTSSGRLPVVRPHPQPETAWLAAWWSLAGAAGRTLDGAAGPVADLMRGWLRGKGEPAPWIADILQLTAEIRAHLARRPGDEAHLKREQARIEQARAELLAHIHGLGGWTLIAVDRVDRLDPERDASTITYIDYTGSFEGGTSRRITVQGSLALGRFVYLMRFGDGIAVPLEPFLRRRSCPTCGADELFLADDPIYAPGVHAYRSVHTDHPLEAAVTATQIPTGLRT